MLTSLIKKMIIIELLAWYADGNQIAYINIVMGKSQFFILIPDFIVEK